MTGGFPARGRIVSVLGFFEFAAQLQELEIAWGNRETERKKLGCDVAIALL